MQARAKQIYYSLIQFKKDKRILYCLTQSTPYQIRNSRGFVPGGKGFGSMKVCKSLLDIGGIISVR